MPSLPLTFPISNFKALPRSTCEGKEDIQLNAVDKLLSLCTLPIDKVGNLSRVDKKKRESKTS